MPSDPAPLDRLRSAAKPVAFFSGVVAVPLAVAESILSEVQRAHDDLEVGYERLEAAALDVLASRDHWDDVTQALAAALESPEPPSPHECHNCLGVDPSSCAAAPSEPPSDPEPKP